MLFEGPVVSYVAAFSASLGIFNIFYVLILSSLGNIVGDVILFYVGRFGKRKSVEKYERDSLNPTKMGKIKGYLKRNPGKTIAAVKLTPFLPIPGLILIGSSDIKFRSFLFYSVLVSVIYCLVVVALGFYSGLAFLTIAKYVKYAEYLIGGAIIIGILTFFLIKFVSRKISNRIQKI